MRLPLDASAGLLAALLTESGAELTVGAVPATTSAGPADGIAAALSARGVTVCRTRSGLTGSRPDLVIDERAELTRAMAAERPEDFARIRGVVECTGPGTALLRELDPPFPVLSADPPSATHPGIAQAVIQTLLRRTNMVLPGKLVALLGYGGAGRSLAAAIRATGGRVVVLEADPLLALEASLEGHRVDDAAEGLSRADVVITVGRRLSVRHLPLLKPGAVLARAGDGEIELDLPEGEGIMNFRISPDREVFVIDGGAPPPYPAENADLTLSTIALACRHLATAGPEPGVRELPREIHETVARAGLTLRGLRLDSL
ncbi:hypothetical protein [Rhizohabitans arisaemae]|uniref:hypothetical protein n=1 Tax=Rhizohabitans arisaemae TaxID=2720610 RepID=UPI0024B1A4D6|nr:hypothetical protein [Rhizohabitans arisaemae]